MVSRHLPGLLTAWACGQLLSVPVAWAAEPIDYAKQVKPILSAHCYACHGGFKQESGLRLDTGALARKGGESGPAVVPGQPDKSLMLERLQATDKSVRMPPDGQGDPLKPAELRVLIEWIRQGAASPKTEAPQADPRAHWAFQAPRRQPVAGSPASRNPIDDYVAALL